MKLQGKLIISLIIAALASALLGYLQENAGSFGLLFGVFATATIATTLLGTLSFGGSPSVAAPKAQSAKKSAPRAKKPAKPAAKSKPPVSGKREEGEVKWFNVTKGFGFITRDNGEEIFVHFRSIRGEGRRSLRDGQRVTYVMSDSDKGPQAEDVEGLE